MIFGGSRQGSQGMTYRINLFQIHFCRFSLFPLFSLFCLIWGTVFCSPAAGDGSSLVITADMQHEYAESCYENKDYETAVVEFKRFIHFFPSHSKENEVRFKIAMALYHLGKYHEAARGFNDMILAHQDEQLTREACFMQAECFIRLNKSDYAGIVYQNTKTLFPDRDTLDRVHAGLARLSLIQARNMVPGALDQAGHYLEQISEANPQVYEKDRLLAVIREAEQASEKDPRLSGVLSVIPGLGYLYCERYHDAFMTFCLNAGLILAAVKAHEDSNDPLAGVLAIVETGFYAGNIYGAVSAAHKHNREVRVRIFDRYIDLTPAVDMSEKGVGVSFSLNF